MNVNVSIPFLLWETGLVYGINNRGQSNTGDLHIDTSSDDSDSTGLGAFGGPKQHGVMSDSDYQRYDGSGIINQNASHGNGPVRDGPPPNHRFPEMSGVNPEAFKLPRKPTHEGHVSDPTNFPSDSDINDAFPKVPERGMNRDRWPGTEFLQDRADKFDEFKEMVMHYLNVDPCRRDSSSRRFNGPHGYGGSYGSQACGDARRVYSDPCSNPRMCNKFGRIPGENTPDIPMYGLRGGFRL
jgi:hypothetical protein